jgi:lipoprotein-anchoring transpeptidase ErfK/SrfK
MSILKSSWALLAAAFVGLAAVGAAMIMAEPPARPEPAVKAALAMTDDLAKPAPVSTPAAEPIDHSFVIKRILPIKGAIKYGEWHWDDANVPDGPIVVTVDLEARVLSVFKNGYEIGATAVLLGTEEKPTPLGVFPITQKREHHVSNLYDAEMPYMQRLTDDGITLHATTVERGYASHGCIGMPKAFAAKLFATTKVGDRVFITRGKQIGLGDSITQS